jgi:hypothetical protein
MTKDDILRMALEAELIYTTRGRLWMDAGEPGEELELFAALVAAEEREACAKVCAEDASGRDSGGYYAEIIRDRSNT